MLAWEMTIMLSHMAVSLKTVNITDGCLSLAWSGIYHVLLHARDCIDAEACGLLGWCLLNQSVQIQLLYA